MYILLVRWPTQ